MSPTAWSISSALAERPVLLEAAVGNGSAVTVRAAEEQTFDRSKVRDAVVRPLKAGSTFGTGHWRGGYAGRATTVDGPDREYEDGQ